MRTPRSSIMDISPGRRGTKTTIRFSLCSSTPPNSTKCSTTCRTFSSGFSGPDWNSVFSGCERIINSGLLHTPRCSRSGFGWCAIISNQKGSQPTAGVSCGRTNREKSDGRKWLSPPPGWPRKSIRRFSSGKISRSQWTSLERRTASATSTARLWIRSVRTKSFMNSS